KDGAGIAGDNVARGINVVNDVIVGARLTPAHVPPVATTIGIHAAIVGVWTCGAAGPCEGGAGVDVRPTKAAIGGAVDFVCPIAKSATHLVHGGGVNAA